LLMKVYRQLGRKLIARGLPIPNFMLMPAVLFKTPLIKCGAGVQLIDSHTVTPVQLASVTGALLHFKYFSDFYDRVLNAVSEGQHFSGAGEYVRYLEALAENPSLSFYYEKSAAYENSMQLVKLGLLKDDPSFENYRRTQPYGSALAAIKNLLDQEENVSEPSSTTGSESDRPGA
ncbi:MAG: hypothetical protein AB7H77_08505, partial [Bdellovibrionales bacterium]